MRISPRHVPIDFAFHNSWWHHNCGVSFTPEYFFDPDARVAQNREMRRYLWQRYGTLGFGEKEPRPLPLVDFGAATVPAAFGCEVIFSPDNSPQVIDRNLDDEAAWRLREPDILHSYPVAEIIRQMDYLEQKYGYITGDLDWDGILNLAVHLRGQQLFLDFYERPDLAQHILRTTVGPLVELVTYVRGRTGTSSVAVTPIVADIDRALNVVSNCTVSMISPSMYERFVLPHDRALATRLQPFGIHHCGTNMHLFAQSYAKVGAVKFYEVGWGSDVQQCRRVLGEVAWLNARLSPVRLLNCTPAEIRQDVMNLLSAGRPLDTLSISVMGVEYGTPDENVEAAVAAVEEFGRF